MNRIDFTFSDLIAGYVTQSDPSNGTFTLRTPGGSEFSGKLTAVTYAEFVRNLGESYQDATGQMRELLRPDQYVFAYGIFYPEGGDHKFEAKHLVFPGRKPGEYVFERQGTGGSTRSVRSRTSTSGLSSKTARLITASTARTCSWTAARCRAGSRRSIRSHARCTGSRRPTC
jgi:hypothetical protein